MSTTDPNSSPYDAPVVEAEIVRAPELRPNKPKFVYVLAVSNLLFSVVGGYFYGNAAIGAVTALVAGRKYKVFDFFVELLVAGGVVGAVLLLVSSIGLFRFRPIGRKASLWYVVTSLATTALLVAAVFVDLTRKVDGVIDGNEGGVLIFGIPIILVRLIYPSFLFFSLRHKTIANALMND